jgi:hypothetical protein
MTDMNTKKWRIEELPIKNLSMWDENARFPSEYFNKSEQDLVAYFLSKKDFKIREFAQEIVDEFEMPQLEKIVVLEDRGKKIVLEGNRRLTVYKLLCDPSLSVDEKVRDFFFGLAKQVKINQNYKLEAIVSKDKDEGLKYVDRKHNKSNNEVGWGEYERHNHKIRRGQAGSVEFLRLNLGKMAKKVDLPEEMKTQVLGKGFVTNFFGMVDSEPASRHLNYKKTDTGELIIKDEKQFLDKLKVVVYDLLSGREFNGQKINSRSLNTNKEKEEYFNSISKADVTRIDEEIKDKTVSDLFGEKKLTTGKEKKGLYKKEQVVVCNSLISNSTHLPNVRSEKIREVYKELCIIDVNSCPTAVASLLRVLLEVTVKDFLLKKELKLNDKGHLIVTNGEKNKTELKEKLNYIVTQYADGEVRSAMVALNEDLLTQNLNQVMHSTIFHATEPQIRSFWKNVKHIFEFLIEEIKKIETKS